MRKLMSLGLILLGFIGLYIFKTSPVTIDSQGVLDEPFYLIPTSMFSLFLGLGLFLLKKPTHTQKSA